MKAMELRELTPAELVEKLDETQEELFTSGSSWRSASRRTRPLWAACGSWWRGSGQ